MKKKLFLALAIAVFGLFTITQAQIEIPCFDPEILPDEVMVSVQHAIEDFEPDRLDSYFLAIIGEGTVLDGDHDAYCLDYDRSIRPPGYDVRETPMMAEVYLSYDCESLPDISPSLIEDCTAIGKVNWILNNIAVGDSSDCEDAYTFGDIQRAIWEYLDDNPGTSGLGDWEPCRVLEIKTSADAYEADNGMFIPMCDELLGIIILPYVYMLDDEVLVVPGTEDPDNDYPGDPRYIDIPAEAELVYVQPIIITIPVPCCGCRLTGGGNDENVVDNFEPTASAISETNNRVTFGGQAGANTALPPQPKGEWTHSQKSGPSGKFTFHAGTASAPEGTEIIEIRCSDPGTCTPSGDPPSPAKQLDFDGIGTFKNIGSGKWAPEWPDGANVKLDEKGKGMQGFSGTFHYFQVNADDNGEPGNQNADAEGCPDIGFGEKGVAGSANCDCPDFYRITIYRGVTDPSSLNKTDVIYEFHGYLDGGNLQIHYLTGYDLHNMVSLNELAENWLEGV